MAYNEDLANRLRQQFAAIPAVEEKKMMGGLTFIVNGKMCIGIIGNDLMCRIDPSIYEDMLERLGCREMTFTGRALKGYVLVDNTATDKLQDLEFWVKLCLEFNPRAKSSKNKLNQ